MKRFLQVIASYITPIKLQQSFSEYSNDVEVFMSKGQYMLCSGNATYSYGLHYTPFKKALEHLSKKNSPVICTNFLMLGGGLGSALNILKEKYKLQPITTIVEKDIEIIQLAKKYNKQIFSATINYIHGNAFEFVEQANKNTYDLVFVDIFIEMKMPKALTGKPFLLSVSNLLQINGLAIYNTHFQDADNANTFDKLINEVSCKVDKISFQKNTIYIAYK